MNFKMTNIVQYIIRSHNYSVDISLDREQYERDLKERQRLHLQKINHHAESSWIPCMHNACPDCVGTGIKRNGGICIHSISCPCPKCSPTY